MGVQVGVQMGSWGRCYHVDAGYLMLGGIDRYHREFCNV